MPVTQAGYRLPWQLDRATDYAAPLTLT